MGMFSDAVVEGATEASPSGGGAEEDMMGWLLDVGRWREQELSLYEKTMIHLNLSMVYRDQQEAKDTEFSWLTGLFPRALTRSLHWDSALWGRERSWSRCLGSC